MEKAKSCKQKTSERQQALSRISVKVFDLTPHLYGMCDKAIGSSPSQERSWDMVADCRILARRVLDLSWKNRKRKGMGYRAGLSIR